MHPKPDSTIYVKFFSPLDNEFVGVSKISSVRIDPNKQIPQQIKHETKWLIPREKVYALMDWLKDPLSDLDGIARLINARYDTDWSGDQLRSEIQDEYNGNGHKAMSEWFINYDKKKGFHRGFLHRQIDEGEYYDWISLWELGVVAKRGEKSA